MTQSNTIHGVELHKMIEQSKTVEAIATMQAQRQRIRGFTDIRRLKTDVRRAYKIDLVDAEAEAWFKALEKEGAGVIVRSRKYGVAAKFLWKYDMRRVATAALSGQDLPVTELPKGMQRTNDGPRKRRAPTEVTTVELKTKSIEALPTMLKINGRNFIDIPEAEYNELKTLRDTIRKLIK